MSNFRGKERKRGGGEDDSNGTESGGVRVRQEGREARGQLERKKEATKDE